MPDPGNRPTVLLITAGDYHNCDFVCRELFDLLGENDLLRTRCSADFAGLREAAPDLLITYTSNVFPTDAQRADLRAHIAAGGRWLAIHSSAALICFQPPELEFQGIRLPGLTDTPDNQPDFMDLLGCRFISHLAQQTFTIMPTAIDHPVTAGLPAFKVNDEPYILDLRGPCEILLDSHYVGEAPGYVNGPWLEDDPRPQLLLHRHGAGEILYLAPGHACGRFDLRPFIDEMPVQSGPWHVPEYREIIRRAIAWGTRIAASPPTADQDTSAIERTLAAIDRAVDAKQWDDLTTLHAETVLVDIDVVGGAQEVAMSRSNFIAEVASLNPPDKIAYHGRSNNRITCSGDTARVTANSYGYNRVEGLDPPTYEVWGSVEYDLARQDGSWHVTRMRLAKWHEAGNPMVSQHRVGPA